MAEAARIVLVGFMGAGKSTVGPLLAARIGWDFLDLDRAIESDAGRTVAQIFASEGEAGFRERERAAALRAAARSALVLATGGGAFSEPATREALRAGAFTVWLRCALDEALRRLPDDGSRPLRGKRGTMQGILTAREPHYGMAELTIDTTALAPDAVASAIAAAARGRIAGPRRPPEP